MIKYMTRQLFAAALSLCASASGTNAFAQERPLSIYTDSPDRVAFQTYADSPDWKFFKFSGFCYASEENDRGVLLIGYDRIGNHAHVAFWNNAITTYANFDRTNIELVLVNVIPGVGVGEPNREWGSNQYFVMINKDGRHVFNTKLNGDNVLRTFGRFDQLVFLSMDGKIVQHFQLGRTIHAMDHLRTCRLAV